MSNEQVVRLPGDQEFVRLSDGEAAAKLRTYLLGSLQLEHLLVLAGSGASIGAGGPSMTNLWETVSQLPNFDRVKQKTRMASTDVEEFLSRCDAKRSVEPDRQIDKVYDSALKAILRKCREAGAPHTNIRPHKDLLRRFSRRRTRDSRLKVFTTNYDRCFEVAASELGLIMVDGFSFSQPRRFDPRYFEYDIVHRAGEFDKPTLVPGVVQYIKLHGSVDWSRGEDGGIQIDQGVDANRACLIYPAQAKFQRSYDQPHLELMARYLAALREANTCLVVVGFGMNDAHLTAPILSALESNPHFRLIVVDPFVQAQLSKADHAHWSRLRELAESCDVAFVGMGFDAFVDHIPDLAALSPAEDLARAVRRVIGGAQP